MYFRLAPFFASLNQEGENQSRSDFVGRDRESIKHQDRPAEKSAGEDIGG